MKIYLIFIFLFVGPPVLHASTLSIDFDEQNTSHSFGITFSHMDSYGGLSFTDLNSLATVRYITESGEDISTQYRIEQFDVFALRGSTARILSDFTLIYSEIEPPRFPRQFSFLLLGGRGRLDNIRLVSRESVQLGQSYQRQRNTTFRLGVKFIRTPPAVVPVPAAAWLFGSGLLGLVGVARRKSANI